MNERVYLVDKLSDVMPYFSTGMVDISGSVFNSALGDQDPARTAQGVLDQYAAENPKRRVVVCEFVAFEEHNVVATTILSMPLPE